MMRGELTLFGAIPALTVKLVSSCTTRLISDTQSSAVRECSSQYEVMLCTPVSQWPRFDE